MDKAHLQKGDPAWTLAPVNEQLPDAHWVPARHRVVEVTETGSSLRANNLRIIAEVLQSTTRLIANQQSYADSWTREKLDNIALMLQACLNAEGKVGLMLNIRKNDLEKALAKLPALERPTVSALAEEGWVAVSTIVDEYVVRDLIPDLTACGATGIVEFPLNKIVL